MENRAKDLSLQGILTDPVNQVEWQEIQFSSEESLDHASVHSLGCSPIKSAFLKTPSSPLPPNSLHILKRRRLEPSSPILLCNRPDILAPSNITPSKLRSFSSPSSSTPHTIRTPSLTDSPIPVLTPPSPLGMIGLSTFTSDLASLPYHSNRLVFNNDCDALNDYGDDYYTPYTADSSYGTNLQSNKISDFMHELLEWRQLANISESTITTESKTIHTLSTRVSEGRPWAQTAALRLFSQLSINGSGRETLEHFLSGVKSPECTEETLCNDKKCPKRHDKGISCIYKLTDGDFSLDYMLKILEIDADLLFPRGDML